MEEKEILIKEFEHEGRVFKYDFDELSILQASLAREASEFKATQKSTPPNNFDQVIRSRGAEITPIIGSYILNEYKDGAKIPFSIDKAKPLEMIIGTFPVKYYSDLEVCAKHFFSRMGLAYLTSILFGEEKNVNSTGILLDSMMSLTNTKMSKELLLSMKQSGQGVTSKTS